MKNASNYKDCILLHLRSRASSEPNFSTLLKVDLAKMSFAKVKNIWYKPTYYLLTYGFNEKGDLILDGMIPSKKTLQTEHSKWALDYKKFWLLKLLFFFIKGRYCWKQTIFHERWQNMFHICKMQLFAISTFARVEKFIQA